MRQRWICVLAGVVGAAALGVAARGQVKPEAVGVGAPTTAVAAASGPGTSASKPVKQKEVLIPARINSVPAGNDFNNPESEYCYKHSKASDNFVLFWDKEYGDDPMANRVANRRFNVDEILKEADRFYDYYIDTLKWVDRDKSIATKYKFLFFVIGGTGGTAFGGSIDNKIGAFWSPATRINRGPYGVVAHELGHSFQAMARADGAASFSGGGSVAEMTSQWMLWQVYPDWQTFERSHLTAFMRETNLAFLNTTAQYDTCYPFEEWSFKHDPTIMGKLWREVQRGEDIVMTYKRVTKIDQEQFNDEMFDGCRRFVTWDFPRVDKVAARYDDQHTTAINRATNSEGWFQIASNMVPQNYGYNAIKLKVPTAETKVTLDFKGIAGADGFNKVRVDKAGWRYGFLAHKADGTRVYSDVFSKADGKAEFTVPAGTKFLWLVVMGAPTEHWIYGQGAAAGRGAGAARGAAGGGAGAGATGAGGAGAGGRGGRGGGAGAGTGVAANIEQWPYQFKLTGTAPDEGIIH